MAFNRKFLASLLCSLAMSAAFAQTTWTGATNTDWNTAANWSAGLPDADDHVTIPDVANDPIIGGTTNAVAKSVHVQTGASLTINTGGGLTLSGIFLVSGDMFNQILKNEGTVSNSGSLILSSTTETSTYGLNNEGTFNNELGGQVTINFWTGSAIQNAEDGTFTNKANISIGATTGLAVGISNEGIFNNESGGEITVDQTTSSHIDNNFGTVNNSGKMTLGALVASVSEHGIVNFGTFNNLSGGELNLDRTNAEGLNNQFSGTFNNTGKFIIGAIASVGSNGLYNLGHFTNHAEGEIRIDRANFNALYNIYQTFINAGKITIGSAPANAGDSGLENQGYFYNNEGGEINIDRATVAGLHNAYERGYFYNSAKIVIGAVANTGSYGLQNEARFYNYPGGEIRIDRSSVAGIYTEISYYLSNPSILDNAGMIIIGAAGSVGTYGVRNQAEFNSTNCEALLDIRSNNIISNTGTFNNTKGRIVERASGNSSISTNAGVVHNLNGGTFSIGTNTGILTTSTAPQAICCSPEFTQCPTNGFTVNTTTGTCTAIADYTVAVDGTEPVLTYIFSGQTTGSGNGTGSGSTFNLGLTNVVITATNACGAPTCAFTVTVVDNVKPSINCSVPITKNADLNQCTAVVFYTVTASDNCSYTLTRTGGLDSGSAFPKGTSSVSWKATDASGNSTDCAFTVTVVDNQPPSITCPDNLARNTDVGQCSAVVAYAVTASDNCPGLTTTVTAGLPSGATFPKGTATVEWKATDASGNMSTCVFTVSVADNQAPTVACPANIVRSTDAGLCTAVVTYATPSYSDNCAGGGTTIVPPSLPSGSAFPKGVTMVSWQATDAAGLTAICQFSVTVNDAQLPSITCPSNQTIGTTPTLCTGIATFATPSGADNCTLPSGAVTQTGGPASGSAFPKGQTTVTFKVTDGAGLTKTCTFRVTVSDTENPAIACPSSQSVNTTTNSCASAPVNYTTPTATDNCSSLTVVRISGPASGSSFPAGTTTVVWRAIDGAGRSSTCSFAVTVTDNQAPIITCPGNQNVTAPTGQCSTPVFYSNPSFTDNCGVDAVFLLSGLASSSSFPQGTTTNVWRAVDVNGGSATCAFTVTVACGTGAQGASAEREDLTAFEERGDLTTFEKLSNLDLRLAPNPATTAVQISIENLSEAGGDITVLDAQGRLMWQSNIQSPTSTVSLEGFAAGLYFVTLRSADGQVATKRLVVQRL